MIVFTAFLWVALLSMLIHKQVWKGLPSDQHSYADGFCYMQMQALVGPQMRLHVQLETNLGPQMHPLDLGCSPSLAGRQAAHCCMYPGCAMGLWGCIVLHWMKSSACAQLEKATE